MDKDRYDEYQSPFVTRWASMDMCRNWSDRRKFVLWRRLWIALAEAQMELGLPIKKEQIEQMRAHAEIIDFERVAELEKALRHDVMAHVHFFGEQCPNARPIIHWGATSCFVGDNADLVMIRDALGILIGPLVTVISALADFAQRHKELPCLAYTHFQPAQVTTVGKRACLWLQDFLGDLAELERLVASLPFRGVKGTTGTQASFLGLFKGDHDSVRRLEKLIAARMGFEHVFPVTGQTYPRKLDFRVVSFLSSIGQSAAKMAGDVRLLSGLKELEEPFGKSQVGSSAMPYKRNPMRCERICSLARFVHSLLTNPAFTASEQWLERTLDDSANRRLVIAESFLAADSILRLAANVSSGLVVYPALIRRRLEQELPFMASESILMEAVRAGGDRQTLHELIRTHAVEAGRAVKEKGGRNDLIERLRSDPAFSLIKDKFAEIIRPEHFLGRAPQQVDEFLATCVHPVLQKHKDAVSTERDLKV